MKLFARKFALLLLIYPLLLLPLSESDIFLSSVQAADEISSTSVTVTEGVYASDPNHVIHFPDPYFEQAVRDYIGKPARDIRVGDVHGLTEFPLFTAHLTSIEGIQYFANLRFLSLSGAVELEDLIGMNRSDETPIDYYSDIDDIAPWAREAVLAALEQGIINGYPDQTLRPQASLTRGEAAVLIYRLVTRP